MSGNSEDLYTYRMTVSFADGRAAAHCRDDPHWFILGQHQQSTCGHPGLQFEFRQWDSGSSHLSQRQLQVVFYAWSQTL